MKLFEDNGYLNMAAIIETKLPFIIVIGGRAVGKTYGAFKYVLEHFIKFILMRRTQSQIDLINKPEFSPFKSVAGDLGRNIITKSVSKYNAAFYDGSEDMDGNIVPGGPALGYSMALSTVSNLRGFDASDCDILIFDEFIPEKHERPIKGEGEAFLNAVETINRNRELKGFPPIQCLLLANSNDIGNPLFITLDLIPVVEKMISKGQRYRLDYERGLGIFLIADSEILRQKQNTALYKLAAGTEFYEMALKNQFDDFKYNSVSPQPIAEYKPICTLGEITFYKHKSERRFYCSTLKLGSPDEYAATDVDIKRWCRKYNYIWQAYMKKLIYFESVTAEVLYRKYMG